MELAFALMGMTVGCLVGLWVGVATEKTRTREVSRVLRSRARAYRRRLEASQASARPHLVPASLGDEGGAGSYEFGVVG